MRASLKMLKRLGAVWGSEMWWLVVGGSGVLNSILVLLDST